MTISRHCEERKRRSNPVAALWFWIASPSARNDGVASVDQQTVLKRSMQVRKTSSPGFFHQFSAEKISTSCGPV
jgi:hypothetical protein